MRSKNATSVLCCPPQAWAFVKNVQHYLMFETGPIRAQQTKLKLKFSFYSRMEPNESSLIDNSSIGKLIDLIQIGGGEKKLKQRK